VFAGFDMMLKNILLTFAAIIVVLVCCDIGLSFTDIDMRFLRKILWYQSGDLEVHRVSDDKERLYELVPGASFEYPEIHPKDANKYIKRVVTVNNLGFRDIKRRKAKKEGIFRIIVFGSSNTYGALVSDEDTYPALMQKFFDETYPGKVEVWNAGINAYMVSQEVAYAEYAIKNFDPDLLIFQDYMTGRRLFHYNTTPEELKTLFLKNHALYAENTPFFFSNQNAILLKAHYFLAAHSPLYRICCADICIWLRVCDPNPKRGILEKYTHFWAMYGQTVSNQSFGSFAEKYKRIPIILFEPFSTHPYIARAMIKENVKIFMLNNAGKPEEYFDSHPPSYVYEWYARELCNFLIKNGCVILK
jgi:hypothetical protein